MLVSNDTTGCVWQEDGDVNDAEHSLLTRFCYWTAASMRDGAPVS